MTEETTHAPAIDVAEDREIFSEVSLDGEIDDLASVFKCGSDPVCST